ncbi:MAG: isoleucine--tRNA ligase [Synergistetes bacterium]|nr:isoleucine--tRNA ligase [Synergistota bacterium]
MKDDYTNTLNLPKTKFPMKANLPKKEPELLEFWQKDDIYKKSLERRRGSKEYILHDGPPYANGNIHMGTAFNKILKDFIVKYKLMSSYYVPYVPGWDTHGLPIEHRVTKEEGIKKGEMDPLLLRAKCKEYALKYVDIQREEFKRLGVLGLWDDPYITLLPRYEAKEIEVFKKMVENGYIYRGEKPVLWCPDCETALAAAEIEYWDEPSPSIYVKFRVVGDISSVFPELQGKDVYVLIWTTTPWTIPSNMAVALHPEFKYGWIKVDGDYLIVAADIREKLMSELKLPGEVGGSIVVGKRLEMLSLKHPIVDRVVPIVMAEYVAMDEGTGCVHTAPGHGREDYETGIKYNLGIMSPLDDRGVFTEDVPYLAGLRYDEANDKVVEILKENGTLLYSGEMKHSYPHCWRCKKPVIFRSTKQWFVDVNKYRENVLDSIKKVKWVPYWGEERITSMVRDRSDWCISRQRVWGVPIPAFYCKDCGKEIMTPETIEKVRELFEREGSDGWYRHTPEEILGDLAYCPECGSHNIEKGMDILDVWFDSGSSHYAVLEGERDYLRWPSDMYLEGSDQHRGWFQTSLLTSVAIRGRAPYDTVLTHGFIVDEQGRKMSKSLGNVIVPQEVISKYGADILRLWVASSDYRYDVSISNNIIKQLVEAYRKIRNTARFILGNLYDFLPSKDGVAFEDMLELDRYALIELNKLVKRVKSGYEDFAFHLPYHLIYQFCTTFLSSFYLDILKDRLYVSLPNSLERRSAQTAIYNILKKLTIMIAPLMSFTAEEIWSHIPERESESVFMEDMPQPDVKYEDDELEEKWNRITIVKKAVLKALEIARNKGLVGHSLEAHIQLKVDNKGIFEAVTSVTQRELEDVFIVSAVTVGDAIDGEVSYFDEENGIAVGVLPAEGEKCVRCWRRTPDVGKDDVHPHLCARCVAIVKEIES